MSDDVVFTSIRRSVSRCVRVGVSGSGGWSDAMIVETNNLHGASCKRCAAEPMIAVAKADPYVGAKLRQIEA